MAITDTHTTPETHDAGAARTTAAGFPEARGIGAVIGTGDHVTIGRLYIGCSLLFGILSLALVALFDASAIADSTLIEFDRFRVFTLGQLGLVLLFAVPVFLGLATAIVPLQVGANTIAFPRAAAAAFWGWLLSAVMLLVSYVPSVGGAIASSDRESSQLTLLALAGVVAALLLGTICVVTTVIALRAPGMRLDRVPLFSWSMLVAGGIWVLTLPVFLGNVVLILIDVKHGAPAYFGTPDAQWKQLVWLVTQPQVFALAIPVLGIAGDAVATFARVRQPQRGTVLFAIGLFGALSLGAYAQPAFFPGVYLQWIFVAQCLAFVLPVLILLGAFGLAMKKGEPKLASPAVFGFVSLLLLLVAAIAAAPFGIGRLGLQFLPQALADQTMREASSGAPVYTWGVLGLVVAAATAGAFAGIFHWGPKLSGRLLSDAAGKLLALIVLVGGLLFGVPLLVLGFAGKSEGLADARNAVFGASALGAGILVVTVLLAFVVMVATRVSVLSGTHRSEADAWGSGQTFEWLAASPPLPGNFGELPKVRSPQPLFDDVETAGAD